MDVPYPDNPASVPAELTAPTPRYRRHAWLASAGLLVFVVVYLSLAGWFGWTAYRLLAGVGNTRGGEAIGNVVAGIGAAFLAAFMLKAVFFIKRGDSSAGVETSAAEQPLLFAFLHRLADDVGAPRPHRVYLSGRVNAAVFYDLSVVNLILPSRKNLEIGLGLVNVTTLGELKAVLAHEFGHFAQRSMAVGRWVYVSQQIAGHVVARRDAFDSFLTSLSRFDVRVAWIGWLLRLIVWSIRALIDLLFRVVVLAQRALSREMEFQADLVSVSVTGSDALINALHRLGAADDAWRRTMAFAQEELRAGRPVADLFAIQERVIAQTRAVLNDPAYGSTLPVPPAEAPRHRLFKEALAAPPLMWSTHPSNSDREENAKRVYVGAAIDERGAWSLFADPAGLRARLTRQLAGNASRDPVPLAESLERLDVQFKAEYLDRAYRGVYLSRSLARHARTRAELCGPLPADPGAALAALYPEPLAATAERLRELEDEKRLLNGLRAGFLTAPGGVIRHRGEALSKKALPGAIAAVQKEIDAAALELREHDRRCRATHRAIARALGPGWEAHLEGLLAVHHYADHAEADLRDAHALLAATVQFAVAGRGGKVGKRGLDGIQRAAETAYAALKAVHDAAAGLDPGATVPARLAAVSWAERLGELKLPPPTSANIGQWLNAVDSWMHAAAAPLAALRTASLEELLLAERSLAQAWRGQGAPGTAPAPATVPASYPLLLPGTERPKPAGLGGWDRFLSASGVLPTLGRVAVATSIIGSVLWVGGAVGSSSVFIYNPLGRTVTTQLGPTTVDVAPFSYHEVAVGSRERLHVVTRVGRDHTLEEFDAELSGHSAHDVYNVGGGGVMVAWTAVYGSGSAPQPQVLGTARWLNTRADVVFERPPQSVQTKGGAATRTVLTGLSGEPPEQVLAPLRGNVAALRDVVRLHARWDQGNGLNAARWLELAAKALPDYRELVAERIRDEPLDALNMTLEQDLASGEERSAVCERQRRIAAQYPKNLVYQKVAARCAP